LNAIQFNVHRSHKKVEELKIITAFAHHKEDPAEHMCPCNMPGVTLGESIVIGGALSTELSS